jgi:hypothetical protein
MMTNRKVRDIADELVRTGELLSAQPPRNGRRSAAQRRSRRTRPEGAQRP